jgi:hypothetical protein
MAPRASDAKAAERSAAIVGAKQKDDEAAGLPRLSPYRLSRRRRHSER